jgi:hypothetical protein
VRVSNAAHRPGRGLFDDGDASGLMVASFMESSRASSYSSSVTSILAVCVDDAQRAVAAAGEEYRRALVGVWFPFAVSVLAAGERFAEAIEQTRSVRRVTLDVGSPTWFALTNDLLAWLLAETGELAEAEAEAVAGFDASSGGESWMAARPAGRLADALLQGGGSPMQLGRSVASASTTARSPI